MMPQGMGPPPGTGGMRMAPLGAPPGTGGMMMPPGTAMRAPGMMPPGMGGGMLMPPGTAMRGMMPPGTGGMMPPGTGMRPPGTGMMPPPGTGMMMPPGMGGSVLSTGLKVDDRPVTGAQQGMMGMKTAGQGPGRQIFDRSYYIGQLRAKQSELNQEIDKIHDEWDRLQNENASFFKLATRQQTLEEEVKTMQGQLADYNLMVDKSHTNSDPEEIEKSFTEAKTVNEAETHRIDQIVTDRTQVRHRPAPLPRRSSSLRHPPTRVEGVAS